MKKNDFLKYIPAILLTGVLATGCEKAEEPVTPARVAAMAVNDDYYSTKKNQSIELKVLTNDTIGSNATVQYGQPVNGTIQNTNGLIYYLPRTNFIGADSLTYTACVGNDCATAMIRISVTDSLGPCVTKAFDDARTLQENSYDTVSVMRNDNLCGNAGTTLTIVQQPAHGQASVMMGKLIHYVPAQNYTGTDEITYAIQNGNGQSLAKVRYNITKAPCVLRSIDDTTSVKRVLGTVDTVSVRVMANDIICPNAGPVTVQLTQQGSYGTASLIGTGTATRLIYTTSGPKNYQDIVRYRICQGGTCTNNGTSVTIRLR